MRINEKYLKKNLLYLYLYFAASYKKTFSEPFFQIKNRVFMKKAVLIFVLSLIGFFSKTSSVDAGCNTGTSGRCLWFVGDETTCHKGALLEGMKTNCD